MICSAHLGLTARVIGDTSWRGKRWTSTNPASAILSGRPREMALAFHPPYSFALEKALRRHVQNRTASAMELWRDLHTPQSAPALLPAPDTTSAI